MSFLQALKEAFTLKHPGHPDQSVHAKRGAGGAVRGAIGGVNRAAGAVGQMAGRVARNTPGGLIARGLAATPGGKFLGKHGGTINKIAKTASGLTPGGLLRRGLESTPGGRVVKKLQKYSPGAALAKGLSKTPGAEAIRGFGRGFSGKSFTIKEKSGQHRWVSIVSGAYPDRDGERVTVKALSDWAENFGKKTAEIPGLGVIPVRYTAKGQPEPVVRRWWHCGEPNPEMRTKGSGIDIGYADYAEMVGNHLVISGVYFDEKIGAAFAEKDYEDGNSIGFFHPKTEPDGDGHFHNIDIFDVTVLPVGNASYPFTANFHA